MATSSESGKAEFPGAPECSLIIDKHERQFIHSFSASPALSEGACSLDGLEKGSQWAQLRGMLKTKVPSQVTAKVQTNLPLSRSTMELNLAQSPAW